MDEEEMKAKAWEEYTSKANNFADWFTAIIISNFVYLSCVQALGDALAESRRAKRNPDERG